MCDGQLNAPACELFGLTDRDVVLWRATRASGPLAESEVQA